MAGWPGVAHDVLEAVLVAAAAGRGAGRPVPPVAELAGRVAGLYLGGPYRRNRPPTGGGVEMDHACMLFLSKIHEFSQIISAHL